MKSQAEISEVPILVKNDEELWRDEKVASIQVGSKNCGSVWDTGKCDQSWINREYKKLQQFNHKQTRHIILTADPGKYESGQDAYNDVKVNRRISELVRALRDGKKKKVGKKWVWERKPITITNWRVYQEWHRSGFPHWHLLIEVAGIGWRTKIGGDVLRSLWTPGTWVKETYFASHQHWLNVLGDLRKNGYFGKKKNHQATLPEWALDIPGLVIHRSSGKRNLNGDGSNRRRPDNNELLEESIDLATGEILFASPGGGVHHGRSYREKFAHCGKTIWAKITSKTEMIEGIFKIPFNDIRARHKGSYVERFGYVFRVSMEEIREFITRREKIIRHECHVPSSQSFFRWAWTAWDAAVKQGV